MILKENKFNHVDDLLYGKRELIKEQSKGINLLFTGYAKNQSSYYKKLFDKWFF